VLVSETFSNPWFCATFSWREGMLIQVDLTAEQIPTTRPRTAYGQELAEIIANYDRLTKDAWPALPLNIEMLTPFALRVLCRLRTHTPRGTWTTYGRLAADSGSPKAARAVGAIMAKNPWPLIYPCHRVLAVNGLGGFGPGMELKQILLTLENAQMP
jgi:methylated-DNA-[protein]-cysteine S-methyltransferase